jgi:hypothetical protein
MEGTVIEPVPLFDKRVDLEVDVGLKIDTTLLRKDMRDDFALACVFDSVAGVEDATIYEESRKRHHRIWA